MKLQTNLLKFRLCQWNYKLTFQNLDFDNEIELVTQSFKI